MRQQLLALALTLPCLHSPAQQTPAPTPPADAIMARVAANQDRSEAERLHYIYLQHARTASRKGKTVRCEEITDYRVTPSEHGSQQQLLKLDGRLLHKKHYITYTQLASSKDAGKTQVDADHDDLNISIETGDESDRDLVENMRANLTNDKSKDGIGAGLFPLTSKNQADYQFHLLGRETVNGRDTFHIEFHPKDKDLFGWRGDAYIDTTAFQPVLVRTAIARQIPFAVRSLLGTSLPGLGFTVIYAPQPDGIWFPISFGTEFKLHVLFFFTRQITLNAENRDFARTHVTSRIVDSSANASVTQSMHSAPPQ